jgi:hypothetical protein
MHLSRFTIKSKHLWRGESATLEELHGHGLWNGIKR